MEDYNSCENEEVDMEIEPPVCEIDVPLEEKTEVYLDKLSPMQRKEWVKWLKNLNFIKLVLGIMLFIYLLDFTISKGNSDLKEPLFEVLKTVLFTASGYVFAKGQGD